MTLSKVSSHHRTRVPEWRCSLWAGGRRGARGAVGLRQLPLPLKTVSKQQEDFHLLHGAGILRADGKRGRPIAGGNFEMVKLGITMGSAGGGQDLPGSCVPSVRCDYPGCWCEESPAHLLQRGICAAPLDRSSHDKKADQNSLQHPEPFVTAGVRHRVGSGQTKPRSSPGTFFSRSSSTDEHLSVYTCFTFAPPGFARAL